MIPAFEGTVTGKITEAGCVFPLIFKIMLIQDTCLKTCSKTCHDIIRKNLPRKTLKKWSETFLFQACACCSYMVRYTEDLSYVPLVVLFDKKKLSARNNEETRMELMYIHICIYLVPEANC